MAVGRRRNNSVENRVVVLLVGTYLGSLALVYASDVPELWLLWAIVMVILSGVALVWLNREKRP